MPKSLSTIATTQYGISLIEVLIACSILAAVGMAFLLGLTTSYKSLMMNDQSTTMESLAKSALEDAKTQVYIGDNKCPSHQEYQYRGQVPAGYTVSTNATCIDESGMETAEDKGVQIVTVTVTYQGREKPFQISGYKLKSPD